MKQDWEQYKEKLIRKGFNEEQIEEAKNIRETYEHCPFEQFVELHNQGVVYRTSKLRKPRNLYVCENGKFWYLNLVNKKYYYVGYFKD